MHYELMMAIGQARVSLRKVRPVTPAPAAMLQTGFSCFWTKVTHVCARCFTCNSVKCTSTKIKATLTSARIVWSDGQTKLSYAISKVAITWFGSGSGCLKKPISRLSKAEWSASSLIPRNSPTRRRSDWNAARPCSLTRSLVRSE